jgi:hypothetical protein
MIPGFLRLSANQKIPLGDISGTLNSYDDSGKMGALSLMSSTKISMVDGGSTSLPDLSFAKISRLELVYECSESAVIPDERSLLAIYWGGQINISVRQDREVRVLTKRELNVISPWICLKTSRTESRPVDLPAGPWLRNLPAIEFPLRL